MSLKSEPQVSYYSYRIPLPQQGRKILWSLLVDKLSRIFSFLRNCVPPCVLLLPTSPPPCAIFLPGKSRFPAQMSRKIRKRPAVPTGRRRQQGVSRSTPLSRGWRSICGHVLCTYVMTEKSVFHQNSEKLGSLCCAHSPAGK